MLAYRIVADSDTRPQRVPIVITLRGKTPSSLSASQLVATWAVDFGINVNSVMKLIKAGNILLSFEGFDEMAHTGTAEFRLAHFRRLWEFVSHPEAKVIVTGRPNFFLDTQELEAILGVRERSVAGPYVDVLRLRPFSVDQIKESLRSLPESTADEITTMATNNERFYDLASRPSLLYVVSQLWESENLSKRTDELTSAFLLERFITNSYRRQEAKQTSTERFMNLTSLELQYFMGSSGILVARERGSARRSGSRWR